LLYFFVFFPPPHPPPIRTVPTIFMLFRPAPSAGDSHPLLAPELSYLTHNFHPPFRCATFRPRRLPNRQTTSTLPCAPVPPPHRHFVLLLIYFCAVSHPHTRKKMVPTAWPGIGLSGCFGPSGVKFGNHLPTALSRRRSHTPPPGSSHDYWLTPLPRHFGAHKSSYYSPLPPPLCLQGHPPPHPPPLNKVSRFFFPPTSSHPTINRRYG